MAKKEFEPEDPMERVGVTIPGSDPEVMAECLVEEYFRMGYDEEAIWDLFRNPFYRATHLIYQQRGEAYVKALIGEIKDTWGR